MRDKFTSWSAVKTKAAAVDPRTPAERDAGATEAAEHREAYVRGMGVLGGFDGPEGNLGEDSEEIIRSEAGQTQS